MSIRQADKIILANVPVTVRNTVYGETFTRTFTRRDRYSIYSNDGGVYDRAELEILTTPTKEEV